jgi:hypothetical protein
MRQYYWRSFNERNILTPLCLFIQTSPVGFAVASGNGNRLFCLQGNCMFKLQINFDHHNAGLKFNNCLRFDPRHFSLLSTFNLPYFVSGVHHGSRVEQRAL